MREHVVVDMVLQEAKIKSANNRRIIFDGEVNRDSVIKAVYFLQKIINMDKNSETKEEVYIDIHSEGGSIYDGIYLCDFIKHMQEELGYTIIGTACGYAMSMGFQILQSCTVRKCYYSTRLMFHQPSSFSYGDLESQERDIEETNYLWCEMKNLVSDKTLITDEMMEEWKHTRKDKFFSREEIIKYKICDEII